jgi:hypothetical protein
VHVQVHELVGVPGRHGVRQLLLCAVSRPTRRR